MGSESASTVEVRDSKSRKCMKKKDKSKGGAKESDTKIEEFDEEHKMHKKRKVKKRKSNNHKDDRVNDESERNNQQNGFDSTQINNDEEASDHETAPQKKTKNSRVMPVNDNEVTEDTDEIDPHNPKVSKKPSIRQMKREKAEKKKMEKKEASRLEAMQKGLNYVSKWKHARSEWKFEKLRQIWLMDNLLDENSIPDDIFPTVLEYFEGCKGMAREQLLKKGMDIIRKAEEDEENRDEIMESVAYKRARQLLQALPTET